MNSSDDKYLSRLAVNFVKDLGMKPLEALNKAKEMLGSRQTFEEELKEVEEKHSGDPERG